MNKVYLSGVVAPKINFKEIGSKAILNFSIIRQRKNRSEWFDVVCFDRAAQEIKKILAAGISVSIVGELRTRDSSQGLRYEIATQEVNLLSTQVETVCSV